MRSEVAKVRESLDSKEIEDFQLISGKSMLADVLTKKGVSPKMLMKIVKEGI